MHINKECVKDVKRSAVLMAALICVLPFSTAALAQSAPSDIVLPTAEAGALPGGPVRATGTASTMGALPVDPCPMPSDELARAPDDLAKVQADIDRYTLCMERAQLLQRLNDVAMENQEKLNQSSGVGSSNPGMQLGGTNAPSMEDMRAQIMGSVNSQLLEGGGAQQPAPPSSDEWMIIRVLGASGGLSAQIGKTDGTLARVREGDTLPDGSSVNSVSATSVSITQDGKRKELRWNHESSGT